MINQYTKLSEIEMPNGWSDLDCIEAIDHLEDRIPDDDERGQVFIAEMEEKALDTFTDLQSRYIYKLLELYG